MTSEDVANLAAAETNEKHPASLVSAAAKLATSSSVKVTQCLAYVPTSGAEILHSLCCGLQFLFFLVSWNGF